jgi:hypothetical protein
VRYYAVWHLLYLEGLEALEVKKRVLLDTNCGREIKKLKLYDTKKYFWFTIFSSQPEGKPKSSIGSFIAEYFSI